jgi:nucleotidyltransferase/DNA polymerase involved in DNA repair
MPSSDPQQDVAPTSHRKIIHIDMDAFYASVEQRDNPELRCKPVAVGGSAGRGVVAAASYEARKFGVRSAMASATAKRQCPDLIFVRPRFEVYKSISLQIREIFAEHTAIIEPLSLDEAYLDVTENIQGRRQHDARLRDRTGHNFDAAHQIDTLGSSRGCTGSAASSANQEPQAKDLLIHFAASARHLREIPNQHAS